MKVLVTGGTGFLGRHVVWRLAAAGMDVVFTGRDAARADQVAKRARKPVSFTYIEHGTPGASDAMKIAAAHALSGLVGSKLAPNCIIPSPFDPRVVPAVAQAVARAACESGVARKPGGVECVAALGFRSQAVAIF